MQRLDVSILENTQFDSSFFSDWKDKVDYLKEEFSSATPYPHVVIDNFFETNKAEELISNFPEIDWKDWLNYYNPIEIKKVYDDISNLPLPLKEIFYQLNSDGFIQLIRQITDIENLEFDPYLHGGGLHCIPQGGKLNLHLDYSLHPITGKERRINLIIYMNKNWREEWQGNLELWNSSLTRCEKSVVPIFNRAVIFQTFDESWHGHPRILRCPRNEARRSLAVYYVSEARENVAHRNKAQFIQTPGEAHDPRIEKLLEIRVNRRITQEDIQTIFPDWEDVTFSACSKD